MSGNGITTSLVGAWESAKNYAKAFGNEFTSEGYYAEKFRGTKSVGDALSRVGEVYKESGEIALDTTKQVLGKIDEYNPVSKAMASVEKNCPEAMDAMIYAIPVGRVGAVTEKGIGIAAKTSLGQKVVQGFKGLVRKILPAKNEVINPTVVACRKATTVNGKRLLSNSDIKELFRNRNGLGGEPISHFGPRVRAVLSNPEEVEFISRYKNRAFGVWRAIQDPLQSTVNASSPILFK